MELEQKIVTLEREVQILKQEIRTTLLAIQESLPERPLSPARWRKRAWVLALLNLLLAITLFANVRFYSSDIPAETSSYLWLWLRGGWVALAFVWLLLQIYPLLLVLEQGGERQREAAWHHAIALLLSNPALTLMLTLFVLITAIASMVFPSLWFVITVALFTMLCITTARHLFHSYRARGGRGEK